MRKKALNIYKWFFIIGALYTLWMFLTGIQIPCFFKETLGADCPGCGLTRMFTCMLCLDFVSAFYFNPVMFILFFLWNIVGILCIFEKGRLFTKPKFLWGLFWVSITAAIVYGICRNFI